MARQAPRLMVLALDGAVPGYIRQLAAEGKLPGFSRLMERGVVFTDARPPFPTITPTCWSSFATGALPRTHGATCQDLLTGRGSPTESITAYHARNVLVPPFWKAIADAGEHCCIMQLPASGPVDHPRILQVGGASCSALREADPDLPTSSQHAQIPAHLFVTDEYHPDGTFAFDSPGSGQWQPGEATTHRAQTLPPSPDGRAGDRFMLRSTATPPILPFEWTVTVRRGEIDLTWDGAAAAVTIREGTWSDYFDRTVDGADRTRTVGFRAKLFEADPDHKRLRLFITESGEPYVRPAWYAELARSVREVPAQHGHHGFLDQGLDGATFLEAERFNFDWQLELLDRTLDAAPVSMALVYSVYLDSINHRYRSVLEGLVQPEWPPLEYVERFYEQAYRLADETLVRMLELADDRTTIVVLSDHGSVGFETLVDPYRALEEAGLLVRSEGTIDFAQTRAFPFSTCHVYVNRAVVADREYDATRAAVIRALQSGFGEHLAFALRREEAGLVGLGGERTGDVVYGIAGGSVGGHIGGVHAVQSPTAVSPTGDIRPLLIMAGPAFRRGAVVESPAHLYDIAPTLCHALGWPQPERAEGAVLFGALERSAEGRA